MIPIPKELSEAIGVLAHLRLFEPMTDVGRKSVQIAVEILQALQNGELVEKDSLDRDSLVRRCEEQQKIIERLEKERAEFQEDAAHREMDNFTLQKQLSEKSEETEKYKDEIEK